MGGAGRCGAVERPAGLPNRVAGRGQGRVSAVADGPLARQRGAGGLFLATSQVEHDSGAEVEGAHRQIAWSASTASPNPTRLSAG